MDLERLKKVDNNMLKDMVLLWLNWGNSYQLDMDLKRSMKLDNNMLKDMK